MIRALIALYSAPLIVSLLYGPLFPAAAAVMLSITTVIALPLFFLFRRKNWLRWWHAGLVGTGCGLVFAGLFALLASSGWVDAYGLQSAIPFMGIGLAASVLFWCLGLFRNSSFPAVPTAIPHSMLALVPLSAIGFLLYRAFPETTFHVGTIIEVRGEAPSRIVTVRLGREGTVEIPFINDDRPTSILLRQCWHVSRHWSTSRWAEVYSLSAPMGVNDC